MTDWSAAALSHLQAVHPWMYGWLDCGIPRLSDVLAFLNDTAWIQFEIKADSQLKMDRLCHQLLWLLDTFNFQEKAVVTSFNRWVLQHIKHLRPTLRTGFVTDDSFGNPLKTALKLGAEFVIPHHSLVSDRLVAESHQAGLHVSTWTVNKLEDALRIQAAGADSLITDYPTMLGRALNNPVIIKARL
jgi:glycerophosphoryl diester phosphodiesterase